MRSRRSVNALLLLASGISPSGALAQSTPTIGFEGEIRPRTESREPVDGEWDHFTSMRTRLGLRAEMDGELRLFFQIQDVRVWGEETSVRDRSADAMDLHQAYLEVGELPGIGGVLRAGRQEVAIGESRLIGAPDWGQAGQAFDGVRWFRPAGERQLELVFLQLKESSSPTHEENARLLAASYSHPLRAGEEAEVYAIYTREWTPAGPRHLSVSGIWRKDAGPYALRLQGIYQTGKREGADVEAYLLAASGTLRILGERGSLTLWYDRLSGDSDPDDDLLEAFSTLFGARNRFYGRADYFAELPTATADLGLQDGALKLSYSPSPAFSLNLDLHAFRTTAEGDLSSRRLGEEADAWVRYRFREYVMIQSGYSLTWAGPGMQELGLLEGRGNFAYFMTSLSF
jgi:hypothetical protein